MFVQTIDDEDISTPPPAKKLKKSQCTPLFMCAYRMRGKIYTGLMVFFCTYYIQCIDLQSSKSRDFYDIKQLTTTSSSTYKKCRFKLWMMCQVSKALRKITGLLTIHNTCIVLLKPKFMILKDRRLSVKIKKKIV